MFKGDRKKTPPKRQYAPLFQQTAVGQADRKIRIGQMKNYYQGMGLSDDMIQDRNACKKSAEIKYPHLRRSMSESEKR